MTQSTDLPEGWIAHDGGECPLPRYRVLFRDGRQRLTRGDDLFWPYLQKDHPADIIAYKPEQPQ